jgi:hypothetical protein
MFTLHENSVLSKSGFGLEGSPAAPVFSLASFLIRNLCGVTYNSKFSFQTRFPKSEREFIVREREISMENWSQSFVTIGDIKRRF